MNKDSILIGATIAILGILFMAANVPEIPSTFSKDITIDGNLNVTGRGEFGDDLNMTGNFILNFPMDIFMEVSMTQGVTDVELGHAACGCWTQDRQYNILMVHLDNPPGVGKSVNVTLSNEVDRRITVIISGNVDNSGTNSTAPFILDTDVQDFFILYTQTGGGAAKKAWIMIQYQYVENV